MAAQVLRVMESQRTSSPYYPLQSTVFSSGSHFEHFKECESSESISQSISVEESTTAVQDKLEGPIVDIEEPQSIEKNDKESEEIREIQPLQNPQWITEKSSPMLTIKTLKNVTLGILNCLAQTSLGLLDFLIRVFMNEGVHNVIMVTITVTVEVFVIIVFAVATVLATIIINIDDAYQKRRASKQPREHSKGGRHGDVKSRSSRSRPVRRTSKPVILNNLALECGSNMSEMKPGLVLKCFVEAKPPLQGILKETVTSDYESVDCIFQEEATHPAEKHASEETLKCEEIESLPQDPIINSKQSTIYRTKLLKIQDSENLLKKKCFPGTLSKNFEGAGEIKSEIVLPPITSFSFTGDAKVPEAPDLNVMNADVLGNGVLPVVIDGKPETGKVVEDNPLSFVSTKRMFENNSN